MKSMTGYGTAKIKSKKIELNINIKSVNGRFLDVRPHLPREYGSLESQVKKIIGQQLGRGTVDIYVSRRPGEDADNVKVVTKKGVAKSWVAAYKKLAKELKLPTDLRLEHMGDLTQIFRIDEGSEVTSQEQKQFLDLVKKAVNACDSERKREGLALRRELKKLLSELSTRLKKMDQLKKSANVELKKRFQSKAQALKSDHQIEPQRLAQEVALLIDKSDITEEITRLKEHISSCGSLVQKSTPQGKKLDFYSQELLREVNTIGSKSHLSELTAEVVDAKAIIERFREQVQNIE